MTRTVLELAATTINEQVAIIHTEVEHQVRGCDAEEFPERAAILFDIATDITSALKRLRAVAADDRYLSEKQIAAAVLLPDMEITR